MEEKEVILTQEGFDKLEKELEKLKTETRAEIAERIKVALGFGDLSENSEYDEAKNAQAENENKIVELEKKLRLAKIIDESEIDTKTVQVGNTVKVFDEEFDEEIKRMAERYQMEADKVNELLSDDDKKNIRADICARKAAKLVVEKAK